MSKRDEVRRGMFGNLIICYLFLGGAGAGSLAVLSVLEFIRATDRTTTSQRRWIRDIASRKELFSYCWPLSVVVISLAIICLAFDIGRFDRVLSLLFNPNLSAVTVGAYALVGALACATFFTLVNLLDSVKVPGVVRKIIALFGIITGVVAALYTGILLASMPSILFWNSSFLVALFLLSSLSTGVACIFIGTAFVETRKSPIALIRKIALLDMVLIALEIVCLALYFTMAYLEPTTTHTVVAIVTGEMGWLFWAGLVACGLIAPLVLEWFVSEQNYRNQVLWIALLVLIGGLILRFCIVEAANYDVTQTPQLMYSLHTPTSV